MSSAACDVMNHLQLLEALLAELVELHQSLLETVQAKLAAMRKSDAEGMTACATREGELIGRIHACESRRRQAMIEIGRGLGLDSRQAAALPLSALMPRLEPEQARRLDVIRKQLLMCVGELGKVNELCRMLAERMISCHRALFEQATRTEPAPVYAPGGPPRVAVTAQVLDARV